MAHKELENELLTTEFFRFHPGKLYKEIYAVGYNEFIDAVKALKEALHEEFPEKKDEIDQSCDSFLTECSQTFDNKWFKSFADYCTNNLFKIPSHVPVYSIELNDRETNLEAEARLRQLKNKVLAMEYFNCHLTERIKEVDHAIAERERLRERIQQLKVKVEIIKKGKELEAEIRGITSEFSDRDTHQTET